MTRTSFLLSVPVAIALFFAACSDDSSSSEELISRPPDDESFNAEAVEDSTGAEIELTVMGTSFSCDRKTDDTSFVVSNKLSGVVDAWEGAATITVNVSFADGSDYSSKDKYKADAKKVYEAAKKEFKFSDSTFPIVDSEDPYQISFSGSATVSMKLKDLPDYLKKHCDTSKAK